MPSRSDEENMSVQLTIDGRAVEVPEGASVLTAARKLGIDIPTLCHAEGVCATGSCFLCVVRVEGNPNLVPSCVAPAEDGMEVVTDTEEIQTARRKALELLLSDHVGDCEAPCVRACPAGMDIPGFIHHLTRGEYERAAALVRDSIPLPGALGRICPRYCERACRRGRYDESIAVGDLHRFAADRDCRDATAGELTTGEPTGKKVAIVGAGPAGLSAAYHLLMAGHGCTLFDARAEPGGLFRYAVPAYRLPRDLLEAEIGVIRRAGAEFRFNTRVGPDVSLDALRDDFDAVLIAAGAQSCGSIECERGSELAVSALEFLGEVATRRVDNPGSTVVVLGDGHEAVAAARSALRLGAREVVLATDDTRRRMSCLSELIDDAGEEGVRIENEVEIRTIEPGREGGLRCVFDGPDGQLTIVASTVLAAPEREVDTDALRELGLEVTDRGVVADRNTLQTDLPDVFVAGEVRSGVTPAIRAVAEAGKAAVSIDQYLRGEEVTGPWQLIDVRMGRLDEETMEEFCKDFPPASRAEAARLAVDERIEGFAEVRAALSEDDAGAEARRCLQCACDARRDCGLRRHASKYGADPSAFKGQKRRYERDSSHPRIVYESGKCILCGLCVRIAEEQNEQLGIGFRRRGFVTRVTVPFREGLARGLTHSAERCVETCPTGALAWKVGGELNEKEG